MQTIQLGGFAQSPGMTALFGVGLGGLLLIPAVLLTDIRWLIAGLIAIPTLIVAIAVLLAAVYPRVDADFATGTVRIRSKTVPIASITRVTRSLSTARTRGAQLHRATTGTTEEHGYVRGRYLEYRLQSTTGATARVLVTGTPFSGITAQGAAVLHHLIGSAPIAEPIDPDGRPIPPEAQAVPDGRFTTGRPHFVGRAFLLHELATAHGLVPTGVTGPA
ncbi:hypothetical protein ET445_03130 [Agromyces protaetiae]|uniref:Uncharacterized protein n=1 Tax=Agromyces protaetiae TaxID=2509455 RepID=A0A4P6FC28_9MICO|nr:hypothetical protein [Agromyces protaetiae]QAY72483.1 hypothetical protein ET445_03130 [Agromyces protaetiae]